MTVVIIRNAGAWRKVHVDDFRFDSTVVRRIHAHRIRLNAEKFSKNRLQNGATVQLGRTRIEDGTEIKTSRKESKQGPKYVRTRPKWPLK